MIKKPEQTEKFYTKPQQMAAIGCPVREGGSEVHVLVKPAGIEDVV